MQFIFQEVTRSLIICLYLSSLLPLPSILNPLSDVLVHKPLPNWSYCQGLSCLRWTDLWMVTWRDWCLSSRVEHCSLWFSLKSIGGFLTLNNRWRQLKWQNEKFYYCWAKSQFSCLTSCTWGPKLTLIMLCTVLLFTLRNWNNC